MHPVMRSLDGGRQSSKNVHPKNRPSTDHDARRALDRRRVGTQQIRKQRREATLQKRRQQQQHQQHLVCVQTSPCAVDRRRLLEIVDAFLAEAFNESQSLGELYSTLATSGKGIHKILQQLLEDDTSKALSLASGLANRLHNETSQHSVLGILLELSSVTFAKPAPDDYYGHAPLRWPDVLAEEPVMIPSLVKLFQQNQVRELELACAVLGNLVHDSICALNAVWPFWPEFVAHLPVSAYLCASIIRHDKTHYGMDFLKDFTHPVLAQLLLDNSTCVEAAWMLEGITRREDAAIDALLNPNETSVGTILAQQIHMKAQPDKLHPEFLVPALQTVGNIVMASVHGEQHAEWFLTKSPVVDAIVQLLESRSVVDAVLLAGTFLIDVGWPQHSATTIAVSAFVPRLISIVQDERLQQEWHREAICALRTMISDPPFSPHVVVDSKVHLQIRGALDRILVDVLWPTNEDEHIRWAQVLIDLLHRFDTDSMLASLTIIDRVLRHVPSSRPVFQSLSVMNALDRIYDRANHSSGSTDWDEAAILVADLIDDVFGVDDDDDDDEMEETINYVNAFDHDVGKTASEEANIDNDYGCGHPFVFGSSSTNIDGGTFFSPAATVPREARSVGRGRARTAPAWMNSTN